MGNEREEMIWQSCIKRINLSGRTGDCRCVNFPRFLVQQCNNYAQMTAVGGSIEAVDVHQLDELCGVRIVCA